MQKQGKVKSETLPVTFCFLRLTIIEEIKNHGKTDFIQ